MFNLRCRFYNSIHSEMCKEHHLNVIGRMFHWIIGPPGLGYENNPPEIIDWWFLDVVLFDLGTLLPEQTKLLKSPF